MKLTNVSFLFLLLYAFLTYSVIRYTTVFIECILTIDLIPKLKNHFFKPRFLDNQSRY